MFEQQENIFNNEPQTSGDEQSGVTYSRYGFFRTDTYEKKVDKDCNGHFTSILNGGKGHEEGDKCGCDGKVTSVPTDSWLPALFVVAIGLILFSKQILKLFIIRS